MGLWRQFADRNRFFDDFTVTILFSRLLFIFQIRKVDDFARLKSLFGFIFVQELDFGDAKSDFLFFHSLDLIFDLPKPDFVDAAFFVDNIFNHEFSVGTQVLFNLLGVEVNALFHRLATFGRSRHLLFLFINDFFALVFAFCTPFRN